MAQVTIVDCGLSNIDSVVRAIEYCDGDPTVSQDPAVIRDAGRVVLPGVGAFGEAMRRVHELGLADAIRETAVERQRPILGICLGMQLMATAGQEHGLTQGLDILPGDVVRLERSSPDERIPHIGWNTVEDAGACPLLAGVPPASDFYFVHSFRFQPSDPAHTLATTPAFGGFASIVGNGLAFGAQFHPEKSQKVGFALLRNFIQL